MQHRAPASFQWPCQLCCLSVEVLPLGLRGSGLSWVECTPSPAAPSCRSKCNAIQTFSGVPKQLQCARKLCALHQAVAQSEGLRPVPARFIKAGVSVCHKTCQQRFMMHLFRRRGVEADACRAERKIDALAVAAVATYSKHNFRRGFAMHA